MSDENNGFDPLQRPTTGRDAFGRPTGPRGRHEALAGSIPQARTRGSASIDLTDERADEARELHHLADETATDAQTYLNALTEVAAGSSPDTAIPVLLLAVSQILLGGARLGAITDVVPSERFEPDAGPDPDIDPLRTGLANLLEGLDEYADIVDPLTSGELIRGILSDDLADVAADLAHGLRHYRDGRVDEALWWWQFSYLSTWGVRATSALRVLQSMLGHLRLDVEEDTVADAEFEALNVD
ncbi:DUF5063 domain-containing protein [Kineosporia rhizophila]|uniref:DUF5063 domain-containing protein n=1 Tax=Kineosporia TaxID=49184 RepID=UPI001E57C78C|nr:MULTISPECIES: DUF5063 domain-containing protein [Kineosporia]MCE0540622.1 DUF5063 domain-containing protein [Kineosporia rhizophila]GLY14121.1 hypothetical protein Kisp01_11370 [Kineosporia sp. NBRC 101677]